MFNMPGKLKNALRAIETNFGNFPMEMSTLVECAVRIENALSPMVKSSGQSPAAIVNSPGYVLNACDPIEVSAGIAPNLTDESGFMGWLGAKRPKA